MGRPRGSKNREKSVPKADGITTTKHNVAAAKADLTEDQQRALLEQSVVTYEAALKVKNDATAAFIKECKRIKGDGVSLDDVKTAIKLSTPEGEAKMKAALEAQLRVARWLNADIGTQFSLFRDDGSGAENASYKAGKTAGMAGKPSSAVPAHFDVNEWMRGYGDAQAALLANIKQQKQRDADEFDAIEAPANDDAGEREAAE